ncbi:MAG: NepR family anti-sigma factor [Alsobacter sp.]
MSKGKDGQGSGEEEKNVPPSNADLRSGESQTGEALNALSRPDPSHSSPVIAEGGAATPIEGAQDGAQVLPFESMVQGHIGRQLRALYDDVLSQPIPDRFLDLLRRLDEGSEPGDDPGEEG